MNKEGDCFMEISIKDIEILVQCKKLVERMLKEKQCTLNYIEEKESDNDAAIRVVRSHIDRMERALRGESFERR
jgi:hypothetical protein